MVQKYTSEEIAQRLRALTAPLGNLSLTPSPHIEAQGVKMNAAPEIHSTRHIYATHICACTQNNHTHKIK